MRIYLFFCQISEIFKNVYHIKLLAYIPNKKELHITAHASTPVLANELPVYPGKSLMCIGSGHYMACHSTYITDSTNTVWTPNDCLSRDDTAVTRTYADRHHIGTRLY